jgi:hypothetical protein
MALDQTSKEGNILASIKKFLIDNLHSVAGYHMTFDKGLAVPKVQGHEVDRWISVQFGSMEMSDTIATKHMEIIPCSRKDKEFYELSNMRDDIVGYLTDIGQPDGVRRIGLYNSTAQPWAQVGSMVVHLDTESEMMTANDGTKFKIIPFRLRWGAKI